MTIKNVTLSLAEVGITTYSNNRRAEPMKSNDAEIINGLCERWSPQYPAVVGPFGQMVRLSDGTEVESSVKDAIEWREAFLKGNPFKFEQSALDRLAKLWDATPPKYLLESGHCRTLTVYQQLAAIVEGEHVVGANYTIPANLYPLCDADDRLARQSENNALEGAGKRNPGFVEELRIARRLVDNGQARYVISDVKKGGKYGLRHYCRNAQKVFETLRFDDEAYAGAGLVSRVIAPKPDSDDKYSAVFVDLTKVPEKLIRSLNNASESVATTAKAKAVNDAQDYLKTVKAAYEGLSRQRTKGLSLDGAEAYLRAVATDAKGDTPDPIDPQQLVRAANVLRKLGHTALADALASNDSTLLNKALADARADAEAPSAEAPSAEAPSAEAPSAEAPKSKSKSKAKT